MQEDKYYVYAHIRLDKQTVFYVGKGSDDRAYIFSNRSVYWKRIVKKHGYRVEFLHQNLTEEEAYKQEILSIEMYKKVGQCEANFTKGGDGVNVDKRWWGNKISKSLMGKKRNSGKDSKSYIHTDDKLIYELYVNKNKSSTYISKIINVSVPTVIERLRNMGVDIRKSGKKSKKILCTTDNKVFESINDASKHYGVYSENIRKVLNGQYKHTGGKHFIIIK